MDQGSPNALLQADPAKMGKLRQRRYRKPSQ
jgi:hypothetical protein